MTSPNVSSFYNLFVLRRLFNKDNEGRGIQGEVRRQSYHTTITPLTFDLLSRVVPLGKGKYSAPVAEIGFRVQLAMFGILPIEVVGEELGMAVLDRYTLVENLRNLASFIEAYSNTSDVFNAPPNNPSLQSPSV